MRGGWVLREEKTLRDPKIPTKLDVFLLFWCVRSCIRAYVCVCVCGKNVVAGSESAGDRVARKRRRAIG